jgi:hypothetical protein
MNIANPIHMNEAKHPSTSHPFPLFISNLDHNQTLVEIIIVILQVFSPEVQIDHI